MSFGAMFGNGAECSTNAYNPLNNALKHADADRSAMKVSSLEFEMFNVLN